MRKIDVSIAIVFRAGKILICQRCANDSFGGFWEFPGGKRERGETPRQCLARELREELDITAEPVEALPPIDHVYPTTTVHLMPFLCRHTQGEPRPLASQRLEWIEPTHLRHYQFPPANTALIEQVIERMGRLGAGGLSLCDRDT